MSLNTAAPAVASNSHVRIVKKYLFSAPQLALLDQCLVSGYRFLAAWLVGRIAGASALGDYTIAMGGIVLAGVVQESLIIRPFQTFLYHKQEQESRRFSASVLVQMFVTAALIGAGLLVVGTVLDAFNLVHASTATLVFALSWCVPGTLMGEFSRRFSLARLKFINAIAIDTAIIVMMIAGFYVLHRMDQFNILAVLLTLGTVNVLVGSVALIAMRKQFSACWREVRGDVIENLRFGRWFCCSQALSVMHGYLVPWLVYYSINADAAGQLGACYTLISFSHPMILGFSIWVGPQATRVFALQGAKALRRLILQSALLMGTVVALFWGILVAFGDDLLVLMFGPEFSGLGLVVVLLGALGFGQVFSNCGANGLAALQRPRLVLLGTVAGIFSTSALFFLLTPSWQLVGAATALAVGALVAGWIQFGLVFIGPSVSRMAASSGSQ